jgi:aspartyl-tRNA synthetase
MSRILIRDTLNKISDEVEVYGWVNSRRDMGKIIFIDLRDRSGLLQIVITPAIGEFYELAKSLRSEFVVKIKGLIKERGAKMANPKILTGKIEMEAREIEIINESETLPFEIDKDTRAIGEEVRFKYRYLDLRSERMRNNLILRHKVIEFFRNYFYSGDFIEVETPILAKGTPEGAREFIVPSRLHAGKFYVLPQSPQQFKQLLMVAGLEKYFQIARCFRDEDQRGDRQPEFTQLDLEMSFVDEEDVVSLAEESLVQMVEKVCPNKKILKKPFPHLTYEEAVKKYKTDKPDLRKNKNNSDELAFCWITDFPLFEYSETEKKLVSSHHPFTMPKDPLPTSPLKIRGDKGGYENFTKIRACAYDIVLNGYEIGGGSIRIHKRDLQNRIFEILGLGKKEIEERFGHMLEAFGYGAPPHGGLAIGLDRLAMLLAGEDSIREVIAFPKTGDGRDLMMGSPSEVPDKQLKEVHIKT